MQKDGLKNKKKILLSRIAGAKLILKKVKEYSVFPKVFIFASGVGYYGSVTSSHSFTENDPAGQDFLSEVSQSLEKNVKLFENIGTRVVALRTGVVLSKKGGVLKKFSQLLKFFLGAPFGNGKQFIPWIHIYDLCKMYIFAIENCSCKGVYNAVAPHIITNEYFIKELSKILNCPLLPFNIPAFIIKIVCGDMANILLKGSPISIKKITKSGFNFKYPKLKNALQQIYN